MTRNEAVAIANLVSFYSGNHDTEPAAIVELFKKVYGIKEGE